MARRRLDKYNQKKTFPKRIVGLVLIVLIVIGLFLWIGLSLGHISTKKQLEGEAGSFKPQIVDTNTEKTVDVKVYVPNENDEEKTDVVSVRVVDNKRKLYSKTEALVKLLISRGYLPKNTRLIGNVTLQGGVATVNFSEEIKEFSGSSETEGAVLRSLAKTLISKEDDILAVKIVVQGEEIESLGGHFDLKEPIK